MNALSGVLDFLVRMLPGLLAGGLLWLLLRPLRKRRLRAAGVTTPLSREVVLLIFFLFCGGLAVLTLTPRWFHWLNLVRGMEHPAFFTPGTASFTPLRTFSPDPWSVMILLGNVIMFLPVGFFPALLREERSLKRTLLTGLCVTLCVECWQLLIGRSFDVDDLFLNTLGILAGHMLCRALPKQFTSPFRLTSPRNEDLSHE